MQHCKGSIFWTEPKQIQRDVIKPYMVGLYMYLVRHTDPLPNNLGPFSVVKYTLKIK